MATTVDVQADVAGKVWKIEAKAGDDLQSDQTILILESMKMEIPIAAPTAGKLSELLVAEGDSVDEGQTVARMEVG